MNYEWDMGANKEDVRKAFINNLDMIRIYNCMIGPSFPERMDGSAENGTSRSTSGLL